MNPRTHCVVQSREAHNGNIMQKPNQSQRGTLDKCDDNQGEREQRGDPILSPVIQWVEFGQKRPQWEQILFLCSEVLGTI